MAASAPSSKRWLFGPLPDLLLGCGMLYVLAFAVFAAGGPGLLETIPAYLPVLLIMLCVMPHYGGTLLRVYEHRSDRRGYAIFSVWLTLAVLALFVVGAHSVLVGSLMVTVYLTWSPWHYTGQNYGLSLMFLRRRGIDVTPATKRWIYASFILSFALTFLVMHMSFGARYGPLTYEGGEVTFLPIGIPRDVCAVLVPLVGGAYLVATVGAGVLLLRRGTLSDLVPSAALVLTQALWFAAPFTVRFYDWTTGLAPLDAQISVRNYTAFVFVGHGLQYLWVTTYYARNSRSWGGYGSYLGKTALAGIAIWTLPFMLFSPDLFGRFSFDAGMALVVASAVNIHHFILDGAIWKLRSSRVAAVLIRSESGDVAAGAATRPWLRGAVWATCGLGFVVAFFEFYESRLVLPRVLAQGDVAAAVGSLDRLSWVGYDRATQRFGVGMAYAKQGDFESAAAQLERSLQLRPDPAVRVELAKLQDEQGDLESAVASFEAALEAGYANPDQVHAELADIARRRGNAQRAVEHLREALRINPRSQRAANDLAWVLATSPDPTLRSPEEAIDLSTSVLEVLPTPDANVMDTLAAGYAAAGRLVDAVRTASEAADLAEAAGRKSLAATIRQKLEIYRAGRAFVDGPAAGEAGSLADAL